MITLPNPFESALASETMADQAAAPGLTDPPVAAAVNFESAADWTSLVTEKAVASSRSAPLSDAAAEPFESSMTEGGNQEAPAAVAANQHETAGATDDTDCIGEIFYHARRLINEDNAVHRRFVLDERRFMEDIEPMPLFLQFEKII